MIPTTPENEPQRLRALARYDILDTPREEEFDHVTRLASYICHAPISVINLIAEGRQWFKSEIGLGVRETPLDVSICAHAILQTDLLVVPDTTQDERFSCNPLVTGEPGLRFYAGALLETPDGYPLGTLCVLDTVPRALDEAGRDTLRVLSRHVMTIFELRRKSRRQAELAADLADALETRRSRVSMVAHDLRTPLSTITMTVHALAESTNGLEIQAHARRLERSSATLERLIGDLSNEGEETLSIEPREVELDALLGDILDELEPTAAAAGSPLVADLGAPHARVHADPARISQVVSNLVGNSLKFSDNGQRVFVSSAPAGSVVRVAVTDEGPGIPEGQLDHVFRPFWRSPQATAGGTGLGLAIARLLIEAHGGEMGIESELGEGTTVWFTLVPIAAV